MSHREETQSSLVLTCVSVSKRCGVFVTSGRSFSPGPVEVKLSFSFLFSNFRSNITQPTFLLRVYSAQSEEYEQKCTYSTTCYTQDACELNCPEVNIPTANIPNLTNTGVTWHKVWKNAPCSRFRSEFQSLICASFFHKDGEPSSGYFPSAEQENSGIYRCTRSYLYSGQMYNITFIVKLDVQIPGLVKNKLYFYLNSMFSVSVQTSNERYTEYFLPT